MRVVVASGYFDPIHVGHIEYLERSKSLGDCLVVIVNNDEQAALKKGMAFMSEVDRVKIVRSLRCVDSVFLSVDVDASVCKSLRACMPDVFTNGGDRTGGEIPEAKICAELDIEMIDGLGKKIRSSSEYIKDMRLL